MKDYVSNLQTMIDIIEELKIDDIDLHIAEDGVPYFHNYYGIRFETKEEFIECLKSVKDKEKEMRICKQLSTITEGLNVIKHTLLYSQS